MSEFFNKKQFFLLEKLFLLLLSQSVFYSADHRFHCISFVFAVADYVVSDYSCIIYEAAVLGIPLYFYDFDMDFYKNGRGLAIDYENELPGVISEDAAEIVRAIEEDSYDKKALKQFADKYVTPTEHATKDIADFIFRFIK